MLLLSLASWAVIGLLLSLCIRIPDWAAESKARLALYSIPFGPILWVLAIGLMLMDAAVTPTPVSEPSGPDQ